MNKKSVTILLLGAALLAAPVHSDAKRPLKRKTTAKADSLKQVFLYSPNERAGLHIATQRADKQWYDMGMLVGSDYSTARGGLSGR